MNDMEEADLLHLAKIDWLQAGRTETLHAPASMAADVENWRLADVRFACGRHVSIAYIPGIFSRMQSPRCKRCCDSVGFGRGHGSPKNDKDCRKKLGLPL